MEEITQIWEYVAKHYIQTAGATIITTLLSWALISLRSNHRKIKDAPTKEYLEERISCAKKYTDDRIKIHEDKQVLEFATIVQKVDETHKMVGKLLDIQLNKKP